jgi:hypothetical protein
LASEALLTSTIQWHHSALEVIRQLFSLLPPAVGANTAAVLFLGLGGSADLLSSGAMVNTITASIPSTL